MFGLKAYNRDISGWDVSAVKSMRVSELFTEFLSSYQYFIYRCLSKFYTHMS